MNFEDINTYDGSSTVFATTNETIATWREAFDGLEIERAAAICSGGEVPFFVLAPRVTEKVVAIDHSYSSMYFAIGKYQLIEKCGAEEAFKLLSENKKDDLKAAFDAANEGLPTAPKKDATGAYSYDIFTSYWPWDAPQVYSDVTQEGFKEFEANKSKVQFLHGDLSDLVERGPFDLVYLSNALDYNGRNGKKFGIDKMVKPGGYVAFTYGAYSNVSPHVPAGETVFEKLKPKRDYSVPYTNPPYGLTWNYKVIKVAEVSDDSEQENPTE